MYTCFAPHLIPLFPHLQARNRAWYFCGCTRKQDAIPGLKELSKVECALKQRVGEQSLCERWVTWGRQSLASVSYTDVSYMDKRLPDGKENPDIAQPSQNVHRL